MHHSLVKLTKKLSGFYDKIIFCSYDTKEEPKKYLKYQLHRHSRICHIDNAHQCRFSFPVPHMPHTVIHEPLAVD